MNDITALISVEKIATQHRLSKLIAYASDDELRQMAVEVEQYTDRLLEAVSHYKSREERITKLVLDNSVSWEALFKQLEEAKQRIAELESRTVTVKLPERYDVETYPLQSPKGEWYSRDDVLATLAAAGIQVIEGDA